MIEKAGSLEEKILIYLATSPGKSKGAIAEHLGFDDIGRVNKQVNNLNKPKKLITSMFQNKVKGRQVDHWGLTQQGMGHYMILVKYSQIKMRAMFNAYKGYDKTAGCWLTIIKGIEAELGTKNEVVGTFNKYGADMLSNGYPRGDMLEMIRGYLASKLNDVQLTRVYEKLENYSRNWEKNNVF